jgi:hypothetical protein
MWLRKLIVSLLAVGTDICRSDNSVTGHLCVAGSEMTQSHLTVCDSVIIHAKFCIRGINVKVHNYLMLYPILNSCRLCVSLFLITTVASADSGIHKSLTI